MISGFGSEYERTFPIFEGISMNVGNKNMFEESLAMPVYITLNGVKGDHATLTSKRGWVAELSPEQSFGVLELDMTSTIKYRQYSADHHILDQFSMTIVDKENFDDIDPMFKYMIYCILVSCVVGFGFFIFNWVRCIIGKPEISRDSDSSDSEDNDEVQLKQRRRINREIESALP